MCLSEKSILAVAYQYFVFLSLVRRLIIRSYSLNGRSSNEKLNI